jgi:hypothetical protein
MWKLSLFKYRFSVQIIAFKDCPLYNKQKNTWVLGNTRFISRVEHDISLVRCAHSWDIMFNTRNKSGISAHPCIILSLYIYIVVLPRKVSATTACYPRGIINHLHVSSWINRLLWQHFEVNYYFCSIYMISILYYIYIIYGIIYNIYIICTATLHMLTTYI